ncbi:NAD(P)-binding protein [Hypomontagnella submonticulosa]|nr:NAD(P)-binding protein [Hypomontagnella submonticulosa]
MAPTIVLITGANRGLGKGLLERYLALPDHVVIAGNRNPAHPTSQALFNLPKGTGSKLIVVKIDATAERDPFNAVTELREKHGIQHLDIVIANAGVSYVWPAVADLKIADLQAHIETNVYGLVRLYQATRLLLRKASREPMFIPMGSAAGLLAKQPPITNAAYGPSKAAVNWFGIRINAEDEWLNCFVMDPGWVQTELGNTGARGLGLEEAPVGFEESCDGMMKVLATSTKKDHGGKMVSYTGEVSGW